MKPSGYSRFFALFLTCLLLCMQLPLPTFAASESSDWRRVANTPTITFQDADGKDISELKRIYAGDPDLSFDASKVSYKAKSIDKIDYSSVKLSFSFVDYNCYVRGRSEEELQSIPYIIEMSYSDQTISASVLEEGPFSVSKNGYLQIDFEMIKDAAKNKINPFLYDNNEVSLFLQYIIPDENGNDVTYKSTIRYTFSQMILPPDPEETEKEDQEKQDKIDISLVLPEKEEDDSPSIRSETPYLLIEQTSLNDNLSSVLAGSSFTLHLKLRNSHNKLGIDNILLHLDPSDDLHSTSPSNTIYLGDLKRKDSLETDLTFTVASTAASKDHTIKLSFDYEYVDKDARRYDSITHEIRIPVTQSLHFLVSPVNTLPEYYSGKEHTIYSAYANQSHTTLYHVTATLDNELYSTQKTLYLGNLAPGESGSAKFTVFSAEEGTYPSTITYEYQNRFGQSFNQTVEFETAFVEPPAEEETWTAPVVNPIEYTVESTPTQEPTDSTQPYLLLSCVCGSFCLILLLLLVRSLWNSQHSKEDKN